MLKFWNTAALHYAVRGFLVAGFSYLVIQLVATGNILLYIAPHLVIYAKLAAAGLLVLAGYQFYFSFRSLTHKPVLCSCGHGHNEEHHHELPSGVLKVTGLYILFLVPLVLGTALPSTAFAGSIADSKGMNLGGISQQDDQGDSALVELEGTESPELRALFRSKAYDRNYAKLGMLLYQQDKIEMKDQWFLEKLEAINKFLDPFQGKTIQITGFVYRQPGLDDNQFIVGRMAMTHCIADIAPYGIIVEASEASTYKNDAWVTVTGTIGRTSFGEREVMTINEATVANTKASAVPYVYPDHDFASKL